MKDKKEPEDGNDVEGWNNNRKRQAWDSGVP